MDQENQFSKVFGSFCWSNFTFIQSFHLGQDTGQVHSSKVVLRVDLWFFFLKNSEINICFIMFPFALAMQNCFDLVVNLALCHLGASVYCAIYMENLFLFLPLLIKSYTPSRLISNVMFLERSLCPFCPELANYHSFVLPSDTELTRVISFFTFIWDPDLVHGT